MRKIFKKQPTVAVVRLSGVITSNSTNRGLSDATLAPILNTAFKKGSPKAVALAINSPGGSPVQSSLIGARLRRLADEHDVKIYAFCEDVAASGGYWLAASADEIFIDESSIVGSIGVISASFGFHELIANYGIERRVYTAGKDKSMLDPFRPAKEEDITRIKNLQSDIHATFINHVKHSRGERLSNDGDLFTGEIWVGSKAVDVGLVDGIGHLEPKMKEIYGEKVKFRHYGQKKGLSAKLGLQSFFDIEGHLQERAYWAKFGL